MVLLLSQRAGDVLCGLLHSVMQVLYLVEEERLEEFHFSFYVTHLSFIDGIQY